jgi:hypothetical protein
MGSGSPCGLLIGRWAQAVECGLEDRLYITGVTTDRRDGVDQVQDLFERERSSQTSRACCAAASSGWPAAVTRVRLPPNTGSPLSVCLSNSAAM